MHYLVAVDGSESGAQALDHALLLVRGLDGTLTVAYSVEPQMVVEGGADESTANASDDRLYTEDPDDAETRGESILAEAEAHADEAGVAAETVMLYGDPAETIAEYAETNGVDGIVVGHRGLSHRAEGLLGSVAKDLLKRASVPVTVVR
ncbi:universal stress protein [Halogeometricum limi]|uniref:Nucleotide-binding universal stress protein, UspA family n=1 Tax=Halogeometricum limi TaxID=555875 RepID=A0A1I6FYZ7_9EURY|nr:universal stress protein [Halogeometricum limi]SFR35120.1 Nucleotide-binding universal stress protein, UspA family [Halogeometricum limi]